MKVAFKFLKKIRRGTRSTVNHFAIYQPAQKPILPIIINHLFFNPEFGYIIVAYVPEEGSGVRRAIQPAIIKNTTVSAKELGKAVMDSIDNSICKKTVRRSEVKECDFWAVSGIKSYHTFSKKFRCIDITMKEKQYFVIEWIRGNNGAYYPLKDRQPVILPAGIGPEQIGNVLIKLLAQEPILSDKYQSFTTINGNTITFTKPGEDYIDKGDGHTDAYQIYAYEEEQENYIAFLLDSGYKSYSDEDIKRRWYQMYKDLKTFHLEPGSDNRISRKIVVQTTDKEILSFFFTDGDDLLEVVMTIVSKETDTRDKIKKDFLAIVDSIQTNLALTNYI